MVYVIQEKDGKEIAHKSIVIKDTKFIDVLSNKIAMQIVNELSLEPSCARDISRRLKMHEQKAYYYFRKLEKAGIIKLDRIEDRVGGSAKIYEVIAPFVSVKLHEGEILKLKGSIKAIDFLDPFIKDGKFNAKIIIGQQYRHGKYSATARDTAFAMDVAFFFGNLASEISFPCFKIDVNVKESDLKDNLIIIGNPKINVVSEKINDKMPIKFDTKNFNIISKRKNIYKYNFDSVVMRTKNPFDEDKEIIYIAGKRSAGAISGVVAFTKYLDEIIKKSNEDKSFAFVVTGIDRNGDGVIDSVKFLE